MQAAAAGIAAVMALLVGGGLALYALDALDSTGWVVVAIAVGSVAALATSRDPVRLALPVLLASVALGLTVGAVALSRASAVDYAEKTTFTQLWILERGSAGLAEVGVRNEEGMPAAFQLRVFGPQSGGARPLLERTIELEPADSWSEQVRIPRTARPERVNAELYRLGETRPYRSAHVWTSTGG